MKKSKCSYCGAIMREKDVFCPNCGKKCILAEQKPRDRYYDDVKPADGEKQRKHEISKDTFVKVGMVVFGFAIIVAACIVVLCLL